MIELLHGDCLEEMPKIEAGSVDLILTDPPYGTLKGAELKGWNKDRTAWDTVIDQDSMMEECNRILRTNGALILFSQEPYTGALTTNTHGNLPFAYRYTWVKDNAGNILMANKSPVNYTEDVCVFFKKYDTLSQHPLREYAERIKKYIGLDKKQIFEEIGNQGVCHFYRTDSTQFGLCTEKTYSELIEKYQINAMPDFMSFSELEEIDKAFSRTFSRTFNLHNGHRYKSNILKCMKDYTGWHPTQKPVGLMEDLIRTYTNEGDTVLDFTMGSGSTGVAAHNLNRDFIGIEKEREYFDIAEMRIHEETAQQAMAI